MNLKGEIRSSKESICKEKVW